MIPISHAMPHQLATAQVAGARGGSAPTVETRASATPAVVDDRASGLVRVTVAGGWGPDQVARQFFVVAGTLALHRSRGHQVRVLIDLRSADDQCEDARLRMEDCVQRLCRATDRLAILVSSSIRKAQMRGLPIVARRELFISAAAATSWVMA